MKPCSRNGSGRHLFALPFRPSVSTHACRAVAKPDPLVVEVAARNGKGITKKRCGQSRAWLCRSWNRLRRLGVAQRGIAALEYALVAPLLFGVIFVAVETTVMLFADSSLETAASRVTRIGKLGVPEGMNCEEAVRAEMERILSRR